jgi:hypothetical protein
MSHHATIRIFVYAPLRRKLSQTSTLAATDFRIVRKRGETRVDVLRQCARKLRPVRGRMGGQCKSVFTHCDLGRANSLSTCGSGHMRRRSTIVLQMICKPASDLALGAFVGTVFDFFLAFDRLVLASIHSVSRCMSFRRRNPSPVGAGRGNWENTEFTFHRTL